MALVRKLTNKIHSVSGQCAAKSLFGPQLEVMWVPHWNSSAKKKEIDHAATMHMDATTNLWALVMEKMRRYRNRKLHRTRPIASG